MRRDPSQRRVRTGIFAGFLIMSRNQYGAKSLWQAVAPPEAPGASLDGRERTDVVVIGGGVHGMSAALHLAEAGVSVVVLDAGQRDGREAASLASGGLIAPQLIRGTPLSIRDEYRQGAGERFVDLVAGAGGYTFDLIDRHGLACDARAEGFLAPFSEGQRAQSEQVAAEWRNFRTDVEIIDADAVERLTGCGGYSGALLDRSGGAVNPLAFAREMGRRATELGACIYRGARVTRIDHGDRESIVRTEHGAVIARQVVLAANGGNMHLHAALRRTVMPLDVGEVATAPLPADLRAIVLPEGHSLTDRGPDIFTIRYDAEGRLITSATMPWARGRASTTRAVNARLRRRIAGWRDMPLDYAWSGRAWLSSDFTPRFVMLEKNMIAIQACNGRGVALAGPIGREIAQWAAQPDACLALPLVTPRPIAGFSFARHLPNVALGLAAIKGRFAA